MTHRGWFLYTFILSRTGSLEVMPDFQCLSCFTSRLIITCRLCRMLCYSCGCWCYRAGSGATWKAWPRGTRSSWPRTTRTSSPNWSTRGSGTGPSSPPGFASSGTTDSCPPSPSPSTYRENIPYVSTCTSPGALRSSSLSTKTIQVSSLTVSNFNIILYKYIIIIINPLTGSFIYRPR